MHLLYFRAHCVFEENFVFILNKHAHKKIKYYKEMKNLKKSPVHASKRILSTFTSLNNSKIS